MEDEKLEPQDSEGGRDNSSEGDAEGAPKGELWKQDPRFKGKTPDDVYKSYNELESKLGESAAKKKELEELASLAEESAEALAASRNITIPEARALLREESRNLLKKHAPEREKAKESDRYVDLQLKVDKRDLLDQAPEAKVVIDAAIAMARATGRPLQEVYERHFKGMVDKLNKAPVDESRKEMSTHKTAFRDTMGDEPDEEVRGAYRKSMDAARASRTPIQAETHVKNALKAKLFGKK